MCFNPRAHTGRDTILLSLNSPISVSIHAPIRGATRKQFTNHLILRFQSTRPYGARHASCAFRGPWQCFNPRAHTGRDFLPTVSFSNSSSFNPRAHTGRDGAFSLTLASIAVSIHAPIRGATKTKSKPIFTAGFNPRAHTGRDLLRI